MADLDSTLRGTSTELDRLTTLVTTDDGERDSLVVEAPFTAEPLGTVPACTPDDVDLALRRARVAQREWNDRSFEERAAIVERFGGLVWDHREELLDLLQLEGGKARRTGVEELLDVVSHCEYYGDAESMLAAERREGALGLLSPTQVNYHPRGVVGIVSPWNYPLTLSVSDAIPALLAGNSVVLKPDEHTPFVALRVVELLHEAGLPADVCQVVTGEGSTVGEPLVAGSDYVGFTGGHETGRVVAEQAGRNLVPCSLELGGKNPMLVLDDADLGVAVTGALAGCFANAGQLCVAPERIYVHDSLYDEFVERLVVATEALVLGTDADLDTDVGSLASAEQLDRVRAHVEDAREQGATVQTGGEHRPDVGPYVFEPTVLTDVTDGMDCFREETFGPVVAVYPVGSEREAIERANDTEYGLNACVFTRNHERGRRVAEQIEAGTVSVNDPYIATLGATDAPMGGRKQSGLGRRHGPEGVRKFTDAQTVAVSRLGPIAPPVVAPRRVVHDRTLGRREAPATVLNRTTGHGPEPFST
ncbi:succinic semialdehyde dehydrogenase [Halomarina oriensis]|uniref:succinic semialdehyde dehydrogenase n=1 Tax=Halomarina oriensis TaxID=671145 RepID=UPI001E496A2D|nr:succinic semialdehyde dehydrogenase [Halomarina oriensis]